jgi:ADP-ribose pyrophosphatase
MKKGFETVHSNNHFDVVRRSYDGRYWYMVSKPDVVSVIPIFDDGRILLEREFRVPIRKYIYNLPAGHIDPGESPKDAAKRELSEETGYVAASLTHMGTIYESPGILVGKAHIYVARGLKKGRRHLDPDERISVKRFTLQQLKRMIRTYKITDAKTIVAILYYSAFVSK